MTVIPGSHSSIRKLLQASMDDLSVSERKVARALLAQYPTAGLTTVADLASTAGVSPPTVVRFVNRLGFEGFSVFQRGLVRELNAELGSPLRQYRDKSQSSAEHGILRSMHQAFSSMLETSYDELPESEFTKLVSLLSDRTRTIHVSGGRFSRLLAEYVVLHLRLLRSDVHLVTTDDLAQRTTIADTTASTVLVVFDYRRYTEQSQRFAEHLADQGATVCLMTDNWMSPIAKVAKVVLPARVESASPFDSLMAAMALSESVIAAVAEEIGDQGLKRLALIESAMDEE